MGIVVPVSLCVLLHLGEITQFFTIAVTCFVAWGVADVCADILAQPRLDNRSQSGAIRKWEEGKADTDLGEHVRPRSPEE